MEYDIFAYYGLSICNTLKYAKLGDCHAQKRPFPVKIVLSTVCPGYAEEYHKKIEYESFVQVEGSVSVGRQHDEGAVT